MGTADAQTIAAIRSFNRFYTNVLGLLERHILDSPYSLTEVRILLEIDRMKDCMANLLMEKLNIDRGYMSRILKRFETDGLICKEKSATDGRAFILYLTPAGKERLGVLEDRSSNQIQQLIKHLPETEQIKLVKSMNFIEGALLDGIHSRREITIRTYQTKDLEYIIKRHRELYENEYGFGPEFGDYVEKYVLRFHQCHDEERERIWIAEAVGKPVGVIALVKNDDTTAQLRWFLVEPEMRGKGLGHRLMKTVIDFCRTNDYCHIQLWTVNILEAARYLYQYYGFQLTETKENNTWTRNLIKEERWDLYL